MRCKNCGSENDDNLYICQNCGSPLYEEEEIAEIEENEDGGTKVFNAVSGGNAGAGTAPRGTEPGASQNAAKKLEEEKKKKQNIAIIVILVVVLLAIITGIIFAVAKSHDNDESTTLSTVDINTTKEKTTATTTQATTSTTKADPVATSELTTVATYTVSVTTIGSGDIYGAEEEYDEGETVTLIANPDTGYQFDGWYKPGSSTPVSTSETYSFVINSDTYLTASFVVDDSNNDGYDTMDGEDE